MGGFKHRVKCTLLLPFLAYSALGGFTLAMPCMKYSSQGILLVTNLWEEIYDEVRARNKQRCL